MNKISPIDADENRKIMGNYIFDESKVFKEKIFTQLKLDKDTFAYGLFLPKNVPLYDKKGEVIGTEQNWTPVLITSKKQIIEVNKEAQLNYKIKFQSIPTNLKLRWSLDSIKSFLEGSDILEISPKELFEKIKNSSERLSAFRNKVWYKINTLWDCGTYLFSLFDTYPLKEERGLTGTGKTKEMKRSKNISFNSTDILINPSESTLFRETHEKRPTKYIDEAEKLFLFKRGQVEPDSRVELINGSYSKGSSIPRVEKIGNKFIVVYYNVFSPTRIGSINGLYGATEGRAITQIHTRSLDTDPRGQEEIDDSDPEWQIFRDYLYLFGLKYWGEVEKIYRDKSLFKDLKLKKRDLQIWKPILSLAKLVGDDWFEEVLDFAIQVSEMKLDELISESSFDYRCLEALKKTIELNPSDKHYLNEIKENYDVLETEKLNIYLGRNMAQHFKKMGFEKRRDKKGTYIIANSTIFDEIVSPLCPQLVFLSTPSTLSTSLRVNNIKKGVDKVKIGEDKKEGGV